MLWSTVDQSGERRNLSPLLAGKTQAATRVPPGTIGVSRRSASRDATDQPRDRLARTIESAAMSSIIATVTTSRPRRVSRTRPRNRVRGGVRGGVRYEIRGRVSGGAAGAAGTAGTTGTTSATGATGAAGAAVRTLPHTAVSPDTPGSATIRPPTATRRRPPRRPFRAVLGLPACPIVVALTFASWPSSS